MSDDRVVIREPVLERVVVKSEGPQGRVGDVAGLQAALDALGLGTASTKDVAASGDATSGQVVKGNDSGLRRPATIDSVISQILITPVADDQNALTIKSPNGTWGDEGSVAYGKGQAIEVLREDYAGAPNGGVNQEPDKNVLFRVDRRGGVGLAGGLHVATGLRQRDDFTATQGIWVQNFIDDIVGIVVEAHETGQPTKAYITAENANGDIAYNLKHGTFDLFSLSTSSFVVIELARGSLATAEAQFGVAAATNQFASGVTAGDVFLRAPGAGREIHLIGNSSRILTVSDNGVAFFGAAPSGKPTVAGKGEAAVQSLVDALEGLGLVADSIAAIPTARVFHSAAQAIATGGSGSVLSFDSERHDVGGLHDNATNNSRLTAPDAGVYDIFASVEFAGNATGLRMVALRINGATLIDADFRSPAGAGATRIPLSTQWKLAAGDYVEVLVFQSSGGNLNVTAAGNFSPEFGMTKLAEG